MKKRISVDRLWAEGGLVKRGKALLPKLRKAGLVKTAAALQVTLDPPNGMCMGDAIARGDVVGTCLLVLGLVLEDLACPTACSKR